MWNNLQNGQMSAIRTEAELTQRLAEFINEWPLYSPFELEFNPPTSSSPALPRTVLRDCVRCRATPTWERIQPSSGAGETIYVGVGQIVAYRCTHCRNESLRIWFDRAEFEAKAPDGTSTGYGKVRFRKLGQSPAQSIEPSREVLKTLNQATATLLRKGLTSLSHGYGLGALGYFRRVVEDASAELLELFAAKAAAEGDAAAAERIRAAKSGQRVEDRLKTAADALPATLRPGGVNPLAALYGHYSKGIHGLTDDECLEVARQLYGTLEYTLRNWRQQMEEAEQFRKAVQSAAGAKPGLG